MQRLNQFNLRSIEGALLLTMVVGVLWLLPVIAPSWVTANRCVAPLQEVEITFMGTVWWTLQPIVATILQFVLVCAVGFTAQRLIEISFVAPVSTYGFYITLLFSMLPLTELHQLSNASIAFLLVFMAIFKMVKLYVFGHGERRALNIVVFVVLASCFVNYLILLLPFFFVALIAMRVVYNSHIVSSMLFALLVCAFSIFAIVYLWGDDSMRNHYLLNFNLSSYDRMLQHPLQFVWTAVIICYTFAVACYNLSNPFNNMRVKMQKRAFLWITIASLLLLLYFFNAYTPLLMTFVLCSTFVIAPYFSDESAVWGGALYALFILLSIGWNIFFTYFAPLTILDKIC